MSNQCIPSIVLAFLFAFFVTPTASAFTLEDVKHALVGARDLFPDTHVSYTSLNRYGPHPYRANDQRVIAQTSLSRNYLKIPLEEYDRLITDILDKEMNPDGSTQQEYSMNSFLSGKKLKTIKEADYGPMALFPQYRILITDGKNVSNGYFLGTDEIAEDRFIWSFFDHNWKPYSKSHVTHMEGSMFPPSFFGYKPGEMLKECWTVRSAVLDENRLEIVFVEMNDIANQLVGFFEIDLSKGLLATRGLYYMTPDNVNTYSFIQYELHDIQEIGEGFYFPRRATVLHRVRNGNRSLPAGFIENPQPTVSDHVEEITFDLIDIAENGIPEEEFIAPVKTGDQVDDFRAQVLAEAGHGRFPYDLYFEDRIMKVMQDELKKHGSISSLSGGIAGSEYNYLNIP